jgi:hypothetical protein
MSAGTPEISAAAYINGPHHDRLLRALTLHPNAAGRAIIRSIPATGFTHGWKFFGDLRGRGCDPHLKRGGIEAKRRSAFANAIVMMILRDAPTFHINASAAIIRPIRRLTAAHQGPEAQCPEPVFKLSCHEPHPPEGHQSDRALYQQAGAGFPCFYPRLSMGYRSFLIFSGFRR